MTRITLNRTLCLAAAAVVLGGCATSEPFSYLDGRRYYQAQMNVSNASIASVDGKDYVQNPVRIDPGVHEITLETRPVGGFRFADKRTITLDVKPCKRYYFAAVRETALSQDWQPKVDYVEDIAGCGSKG